MASIRIENMEFYSYHGHFKEEQIVGNKFLVNLVIEANLEKPSETDELKDAINYQYVYELVKEEMEHKSHLLENIAKRILDRIFSEMNGMDQVQIKVSKMNPPVGGKMDCVSVTLSRNKEGVYS